MLALRAAEAVSSRSQRVFAFAVGSRRTIVGVRRLLSDFVRAVHPDLTSSFPVEAVRINQRSLAELNAFVDRLESAGTIRLEDGPEAARELPFFRAFETRSGHVVPGRVRPMTLAIPSLNIGADEMEREYVAVRLIRDAGLVLENTKFGIQDNPPVAPLFTEKGAGRKEFDRLWMQQTRDQIVNGVLYGPDDVRVRKAAAMKVFAEKYEYQLLRQYASIKNNKRRKTKMALVHDLVQEKVRKKFGEEKGVGEVYEGHPLPTLSDVETKGRVLESGFHPDLVFVAPDVFGEQRQEAVRRVCGMNLTSDSDFWLLGNLWRAMRNTPPPVPLVIASKKAGYIARVEVGFVQVPWDFGVSELCDMLEEHLDSVRAGLVRHRRGSAAGRIAVLPPPPLPEDEEEEEDVGEGEDEDDVEKEDGL